MQKVEKLTDYKNTKCVNLAHFFLCKKVTQKFAYIEIFFILYRYSKKINCDLW